MKAVIMAGGEGKRLKPVTGPLPKPMVPSWEKPLRERILILYAIPA
jgi:NDP-sugar pyrophosphorylase family protein